MADFLTSEAVKQLVIAGMEFDKKLDRKYLIFSI
jgi:hypothetical protein